MGFEQFAPARDFFYLSALLLGAGCGCMLNRFRIKSNTRFRIFTVTAGLCFFSGALAALTAAVIFSNWMILKNAELYLPLGIAAIIVLLAFRFPRAAGFPVIIISGIFTVVIAYICFSFPVIDDNVQFRIMHDGSDLIHIRPVSRFGNERSFPEAESDPSISFQTTKDNDVLEFRTQCFAFSKIIPFVGGVGRGVISEILCNEELLYSNSRPPFKTLRNLLSNANGKTPNVIEALYSVWEIHESLKMSDFPAGASLTVLFSGSALAFR